MNTKITLFAIAALSFLPALSQNREPAIAPFAADPGTTRSFIAKESANAPSENQTPGITITPNPSEGRFLVMMPDAGELKISVYNVLGDLVYKGRSTTSNGSIMVDISQRQAGVYLVKIETAVETLSRKIVVR